MNFSFFNYIIFLYSFIQVTFSCAPFNCPKYSNDVTITFTIEPRLSITYTPGKKYHSDQHSSKKELAKFLKEIIDNAVQDLRNKHKVNAHQLIVGTSVNEKQSNLLNVTIIDNECLYDCNYRKSYAPAGSYFMDGNIIKKRLEDGICLNGEIVHEKAVNAISTIVFNVSVRPLDKRVFCVTHWNIFADTVQQRMIRGSRGNFIGKYKLAKQ
ncbi:Hypothetical protein SRAE_2000455500 [Strongyloides ratti]|uniref:Uncharacterized protein n=1 Tax=Strongyloides ratti TaxID=34506 RepID=A0A090LNZ3_STRRB|nr:Hypothetical protein SRAE_2000455500 [Strongyloides ratti]CEF69909.1 Hypothetical protein SRAE_2000455500 [Strongyloides ratti]